MKKIGLLTVAIGFLGIIAAGTAAQAGIFGDGYSLKVTKNDRETRVSIKIKIDDFQLSTKRVQGVPYTIPVIADAGYAGAPGEPYLPIIGHFIQISDTQRAELSMTELKTAEYFLDSEILPVQDDQEPVDVNRITSYDETAYSSSHILPEKTVFISKPMILRDVRVVQLGYCPVRYDPVRNSIMLIEEAEVHLTMQGPDDVNVKTVNRGITPSWKKLYEAVVINFERGSNDRTGELEHYLLVMPDEYESRCQAFIHWKEEQGYIVDILRLSEIDDNPTTYQVKTAIRDIYESASQPSYMILFGNHNNFPLAESYDNYMPGWYTDDVYYTLMEGDDFLPDICSSRIPAETPNGASVILNRDLYWELTPNLDNEEYYKSALMACSGLYQSQQTVKEQNAVRLTDYLDYESIHTMYDWTGQSLSQVKSWINDGVSIINYRGEGWQSGWNPGHAYSFHYDDVWTLQNEDRFPIITSVGCGVSMFGDGSTCFSEAWILLGDMITVRGAAAIYGPSWNTRTTFNNWMDRGIYRGFAYHDVNQLGMACLYGKLYMYNHFPEPQNQGYNETHIRQYVLFGAPDIWWRTELPREPLVGLTFYPGSSRPAVWVRQGHNKHICPNALLSVMLEDDRRTFFTDHGGGHSITIYGIWEEEGFDLTVSGFNLLPYQTFIELPWQLNPDRNLIITEIKPDIPTTGSQGDMVELYNNGDADIDLHRWIMTDLDGYDAVIIQDHAILQPQKIAVIEFVGPNGQETIQETDYGFRITSTALPCFSSLEDQAVLRSPTGIPVDSIVWTDKTGQSATNEALDMSRLTPPTAPYDAMDEEAWWSAPDEISQMTYENYAVDWSEFAGNGGPGSIQRIYQPVNALTDPAALPDDRYDSKDDFIVSSSDSFGQYGAANNRLRPGSFLRVDSK